MLATLRETVARLERASLRRRRRSVALARDSEDRAAIRQRSQRQPRIRALRRCDCRPVPLNTSHGSVTSMQPDPAAGSNSRRLQALDRHFCRNRSVLRCGSLLDLAVAARATLRRRLRARRARGERRSPAASRHPSELLVLRRRSPRCPVARQLATAPTTGAPLPRVWTRNAISRPRSASSETLRRSSHT